MNLHHLTGLGRPMDPSEASNRIALTGSALFGLIGLAIGLMAGEVDLLRAFNAAVGAFLGWALARELDPDRASTATLSLVAAGLLGLVFPASLIPAAVVLVASRITSGTVGSGLKPLDWPVVLILAAAAAAFPTAWPAFGLIAAGVVFSTPRTPWLAWMGISVSAGAGYALTRPVVEVDVSGTTVVLIAAILMSAVISLPAPPVTSYVDSGVSRVRRDRVTLARVGVMLVVVWSALLAGGLASMIPVAAAYFAVGSSGRHRANRRPSVDDLAASDAA